jgi:hypothetical protein
VGENRGSISNSYSAGTVTGTGNYFGGLVGMNYVGGAISNSYSTGAVTVTGDYVGGLVGYNGTGAISNSYSTGAVSGTGVNVGGLIGGYGGGTITNSYWDTVTSGQPTSAAGTGKTAAELMTQATYSGWDFTGTWWMSDTNTRPFLRSEYRTEISNAHQLQLMALNLGANYTLTADLNLAELNQASGLWNTTKGFVPVGTQAAPFAGTFDGLGHTITGLYINRGTGQSIGLFGYTSSSSSILNTGLINASILDGYHVGGLVGDNYGLIENSYSTGASGAIYGKSTVGGLVGWNWGTGTVRNSFSTLAVYGDNGVGGLVGVNSGGIIESHSTGEVSYRGALFYADNKLGGLVGDNAGTISNSYHTTGTVTGNLSNVGGLVGYNSNNITGITGSYNTAPVVGTSKVGGLAGYNSGKITESYNSNTGTVSGTGSDVGGLVGYNTGSITDSYNAGTVTGTGTYVGGLTGENYGGTILRSWNTGGVTGVNNVGGLVGDNYNLITDSYNEGMVVGDSSVGGLVGFQDSGSQTVSSYSTGAVSGNSEVGGLVGENYYGTVNKTYSTGTVSGNFAVGGLAGRNDGSIRNSYSTGSVTGTGTSPSRIGGLVGYYNTGGSFYPIENSYSTGQVSAAAGATAVGGLIGWNSDGAGIVNNSYWNKETSGQTTSGGGTGLTTTQMTALSSFSGWDFATIWDITPGTTYPYLQGQALPYPAPSGVTPPEQQVISGTVVGADAGKIVYFAVNGTLRHEMDTITTAGGVFTVELSENKVSSNQALLAYVVGDSGYKGATVYLASGGDITGLLISANTLTAKSAGGTMSNTTLEIAKGSLSSTDIPYFVVNSNLTLNSGFSFLTASGTSYSLNGNITTTGGSQTFNGLVALAATAVLTAIGGSITLTSPLTAGAYLLTLSGDSGVAVNGAVTSSSAITLESSNNIEIASPITAASLVLRADAEGDGTGTVNFTGSGSVAITGGGAASIFYNPPDGYGSPTNYAAYFTGVVPTAYMLVNDIGPEAPTSADRGLQAIQNNLSGTYALGSDIDASSTSGWNSGAGFTPLGNDNLANPAELFTGIFDGFGHTITGLYINRPSTNYVGMFGGSDGNAIFRNVGLVNVNITGGFQTGGLVAHTGGVISNAYTTGTVTGTSNTVGGLVGLSAGSTSDSYSTATVNGVTYVGGLMGANYGTASSITNSYSTGSVTGTSSVGGLSGWNEGTITGSHSTGAVRGNNTVGGLVGINWSVNSITNSYSTGAVTGTGANSYYIGGLVGDNPGTISGSFSTGAVSGTESVGGLAGHSDGTIENSYSTSPVTGTATVGGLVGQLGSEINPPPAIITNSYSTGLVIGTSDVGGLVGCIQSGSVNGSYWNTETSGQATSAGGGTGLTTAGMTTLSSFSGWDPGIWGITAGTTYPYLLWQPPGTYPAASGGIATNLIPPTTLGNSVAAGDTVVALQTVTDAIFSPDAVIPADPFASPEAAPGTGSQGAGGTAPSGTGSSPSGASGASGGTGSSTAGESVSSGTGETSTSAETASTSAQEEEIARRAAARQGGELKREVHPDDEKVQKYCN